jgi:putative DNA primase/helicase
VQRVLLKADGTKISREEAALLTPPTNKITNGVQEGCAVILTAITPGPLLLAEGPETGLSVWASTGAETWIALGSMARLDLPRSDWRMVACRDDDKRYSPADRTITRAVRDWRKAGIDITAATPWRVRRYDGSDFNDLIKAEGAQAVRDAVIRALHPRDAATARSREHLDEVRKALAIAAGSLFAIATEIPPDYWRMPIAMGVRVDVGTGKSLMTRFLAAEALTLLRERGDTRTVGIALPTHKLADEQAVAFNALPQSRKAGLVAAVWRGREAVDPDEPGEKMCRNLPAVRDAMAAGLSVQSAACRRVAPGAADIKCPFFDRCGYQRQCQRSADLWLVPHEMIFMEKPDAIGDLAALVVDEAAWQDGLVGTGARPITLALDTLDTDATIFDAPGASERLRFLRRLVSGVLRDLPNGPLPRAALLATGLTSASAEEACGLEWRRKVDTGMLPGMAPDARRKAVEAGAGNRDILKLVMLWKALSALLADGGPDASGWARLDDAASEHGPVRVLALKGRKPIREGWRVPTLLIDANLDPDLVNPFWPGYLPVVNLAAFTLHQRVRQVVDRSYSKRHLGQTASQDAAETRRGQRNLRDVAAILDREMRRAAGRGSLIVTNKATEEALASIWRKPDGVDTAHFNAVAGRDGWKGVGSLITLGSTNPPPTAVEQLAEALTGAHVPPLAGWYERHTTTRETVDGPVQTETERHPHPVAEAIRWQIREGEVIQAIGRARGVNRTEADPVDVLVMGDAVLPFPVEPVEADDLDPSPAEMMLAAGGSALESPTHAAICYPDLWPNPEAAKQAFHRGRSVTFPYKISPIGVCHPPLGRVSYQVAGAGQKPAIAWVDLTRVPDPAAWLTERLGPLARCEIARGA